MKKEYRLGKGGRLPWAEPLKTALKVPFQRTWEGRAYQMRPPCPPDLDTTLSITKCCIHTTKPFMFESAGIKILGKQPQYTVPYYLWHTTGGCMHWLNLIETPIHIAPLTAWRVVIETVPENDLVPVQKVEVFGYATIIRDA